MPRCVTIRMPGKMSKKRVGRGKVLYRMVWTRCEEAGVIPGDVWLVGLNPVKGHEQSGVCLGFVSSTDVFNHGLAGLVVLLLLITRDREVQLHVGFDTRRKVD